MEKYLVLNYKIHLVMCWEKLMDPHSVLSLIDCLENYFDCFGNSMTKNLV